MSNQINLIRDVTRLEDVNEKDVFDFYKALNEVLNAKEIEILSLFYALNDKSPHTLEEIAYMFDITKERVREIVCKAIKKLTNYYLERKR